MKELDRLDLPRERLARYGPDKLADAELLAIVLGSGTKGVNVLELARRVLAKIRDAGSSAVRLEDLQRLRGLGGAKAAQTIALLALSKRIRAAAREPLIKPHDVWHICADIRGSKREHFIACYLDSQNRLIERQIISIGTLNASLVHPREVFEPALARHAASIIVAHNHPSGNLNPSEEDREVTRRLKSAGNILGIVLADHVLLTERDCVSFRQRQWL